MSNQSRPFTLTPHLRKSNACMLPEEFLCAIEQEKIIKAVNELPYPCNTIFEDYYFKEKRSREIIEKLSITRNKFYSYLDKGKYWLREGLNGSYYERASSETE